MTIQTSDSAVKLYISQHLPVDMVYVKAHPVESGKGRFKRRVPRRVGHTQDSLFSVELYGKPDKVHKLLFMSLADSPPLALARNLTAVRGVIEKVLPEWNHWLWFIGELEHGRDAERDGVKAAYMQLTDNAKVLFVTVT